jgi:hypothetical protein
MDNTMRKLFVLLLFATMLNAQTNASYSPKVAISLANTFSADAFGRLRVTSPKTLFDAQNEYTSSSLFWEDAVTSGADTNFNFNGQPAVDLVTNTDYLCSLTWRHVERME